MKIGLVGLAFISGVGVINYSYANQFSCSLFKVTAEWTSGDPRTDLDLSVVNPAGAIVNHSYLNDTSIWGANFVRDDQGSANISSREELTIDLDTMYAYSDQNGWGCDKKYDFHIKRYSGPNVSTTIKAFDSSGSQIYSKIVVIGDDSIVESIPACGAISTMQCGPNTISAGQVISGSWDSSILSSRRSETYAKYYQFTLAHRSQIVISLNSTADTYLYLLQGSDQSGPVIAEDDDGGGGDSTNSKIQYELAAGTYTIEATTYSNKAAGNFDLSLKMSSQGTVSSQALSPLSPANETTVNPGESNFNTFSWNAPEGVTSYRVVYSENSSFSGFDESSDTCSNSCLTYKLTTNQDNHYFKKSGSTYYWRVRSNLSGWSEVKTIYTSGISTTSLDAAVDDFVTTSVNTSIDMDGLYGAQCVDLMHAYIRDVLMVPYPHDGLTGNAYPIYKNISGYITKRSTRYGNIVFNKVENRPTSVPQKGDIIFWNGRLENSSGTGFGHVAIFIEGDASRFKSIDQNWVHPSENGSPASVVEHNYSNVAGWLHPSLD